jgi:acyl-CoA thioester hydrolase
VSPFETISEIRVRYAETDQMGVAYHTHYLVWCEVGRTDFIRELGVTYARLEAEGLFLAVAEAQIRYAAPARYDDLILVHTRVERVQSRALTFAYELMRDGPKHARVATAATRLVALDAGGTLRSLPASLVERLRDAITTRSD